MAELLRSRREERVDPLMAEIRTAVDTEVSKTLNKKIAPGLMKTEIVGNFMNTLRAYGEHVLEQERPDAHALGGMARWRRQGALRTDSRAQRDSATTTMIKLGGVCCLIFVLIVIMGVSGISVWMLIRFFWPDAPIIPSAA